MRRKSLHVASIIMRTSSAVSKRSRIEDTARGTRSEHFSRNFHISNLALTDKGITNTIYSFLNKNFLDKDSMLNVKKCTHRVSNKCCSKRNSINGSYIDTQYFLVWKIFFSRNMSTQRNSATAEWFGGQKYKTWEVAKLLPIWARLPGTC